MPLKLAPQPLKILELLVSRRGELVTREQICAAIWGKETFVDFDQGLNACIRQIRAALCDRPQSPRYIETLSRRGYRFIPPVETSATAVFRPGRQLSVISPHGAGFPASKAPEPSPAGTERRSPSLALFLAATAVALILAGSYLYRNSKPKTATAETKAPIHCIAVLPFKNLSGDSRQDYLAEAVSDELITDLAQVPSLQVISRTSVMPYGTRPRNLSSLVAELGADGIVEGTVVRDRHVTRVDVRLVSASNGRNIWAQRFTAGQRGETSLEESLVRSVAEDLVHVLRPDQNSSFASSHLANNRAYEVYLHGIASLHDRSGSGLLKSRDFFSRAVRLDPQFAAAYAELAQTYSLLADYGMWPDKTAQPKAEAAARRAIQLDDSCGAAHLALAFVLWHYDWNWKDADREFRRAVALDANDATVHHWYALFLASKRDFGSAQAQMRRALELDPVSPIIRTNVGWISYYKGDLKQAVADYEQVLHTDPMFEPAQQKLWIAYALQPDQHRAFESLRAVLASNGGRRSKLHVHQAPDLDQAIEDYLHSPYLNAYERARVLAIQGKKEKALAFLQEAEQERAGWVVYIGVEPAFGSLRSSRRFQQLLAVAGFPGLPAR